MTKFELTALDRIMKELGYMSEQDWVDYMNEEYAGGPNHIIPVDPKREFHLFTDEEGDRAFTFHRDQSLEECVKLVVDKLTKEADRMARWNLQQDIKKLLDVK